LRRHLIVGDIHGCFDELQALLGQLQFDPSEDVLVSVGDIIDRGPKIRETIEYLFNLPRFHMAIGNHEEKFLRYLEGRNVKATHGLQTTIDAYPEGFPPEYTERMRSLPLILKTPSGYVVHAGFDPEMSPTEQSRSDCIYMRFYGGKTYFDEINGRAWYTLWPTDGPRVFFGHIPLEDGPVESHIVSLDAGCVFGGRLRIFDSRDNQVHSVPAARAYATSEHSMVKHVAPSDALRRREEYVIGGLLRTDRTDDGQLAIYTYTDQCVFQNSWDDITRNARGHIYDTRTGECIAFPFPKFFNLGENEENLPEKFPWHEPFEVFEKMDGWLGVLYRHEGRYKISSRGSFHSSGAVWATEYVRQFDLSILPDEATLSFEIIHPDHKIILNYEGRETLMILAAFNRNTGEEYPRAVVAHWASEIGLPIVPQLAALSLEELLHTQKHREHFEGFVLRFPDGRRVKVKTEWYLNMARIVSNLTPIALWEVMVQGKVRQDYLVQVPEELRPLAERYQAILEGQYARTRLEIDHVAAPILREFGHDRRALAQHLELRKKELGIIKSAVFVLLDGKHEHLDRMVMDHIYPKGNQFVADAPRPRQ
ncbi:MAG: metallophosphoesterase, partial [Planctomycetes bacterium]|nr:metallophosphoesterase [Planctomycetota bacterium]